jgi:2-hydroxychromene-2-carboxylate isomerase
MPSAPVFYFGPMSPYSWLAAERVGALVPEAEWRCVRVAAVFREHERMSWGFTDRRAEEMAEVEERARTRGLGAVSWPDPWPTDPLRAERAIIYAGSQGALERMALEVMRMAFREGADISELDPVLEAGRRAGLDAAGVEDAVAKQEIKDALRRNTDAALAAGVFGIPTMIVDGGELYWGDDKLEAAAAAARSSGAA